MTRSNDRLFNQLRPIRFVRHYTKHAEGSVLVAYGDTQVLCTASIVSGVPRFLKDKKQGWLTAEYGMLPRSTNDRMDREATRGKQVGRTQEIQRLIGRSLRTVVDLKLLGDHTIYIDCDVLQADGGTRTASISGACVALIDAVQFFCQKNRITKNPIKHWVGAVSVGMADGGQLLLDLDYQEDSKADVDTNVVMDDTGNFIEVQGTGENGRFSQDDFNDMLSLARLGIQEILAKQKEAF